MCAHGKNVTMDENGNDEVEVGQLRGFLNDDGSFNLGSLVVILAVYELDGMNMGEYMYLGNAYGMFGLVCINTLKVMSSRKNLLTYSPTSVTQ